ncbi:MAG: NDP-sugar synthase [Thermodesulfobacteriota bacterium]
MKAMVLSAGFGTRLRPLTLERAKPAVPVLGKPLLIRTIEHLMAQGVSSLRLNLHYLPRSIEQVFEKDAWRALPVTFSHEKSILGTAGGLKDNESFFDQGTFLMVNGDILFDFSLADAIAFHRSNHALATLVLIAQLPPYRYTPVRIDDSYRLVGFKGRGASGPARPETYVFTGVHILEPEIFRYIPEGIFCEINDKVYPAALDGGARVFGFPVTGYWNDLGDPGRYLSCHRDLFLKNGISPPIHVPPNASLTRECHLGRFVTLSDGCRIEKGCLVENVILWEDVVVKTGSTLRNCIVGSGMIVAGAYTNRIITRLGEAPIDNGI